MPSTREPGEHTLYSRERRVPSTGLTPAVREYGDPAVDPGTSHVVLEVTVPEGAPHLVGHDLVGRRGHVVDHP